MSDFYNVWQQVQNNLSIAEDVSTILDEAAKNHRQQITKICAERDAAVALGRKLAKVMLEFLASCEPERHKGCVEAAIDAAHAAGWLED